MTDRADRRGVSLKWGLLALVGICWVLPVLAILLLSGYFVRGKLQTRIEQTVVTSVDNALTLTKGSIDSALSASRAVSYDDTVRSAWARYKTDCDGVELYEAVTGYLFAQYAYDENFKGVMLYFIDEPEQVYYVSNRASEGKTDSLRDYRANAHSVAGEISRTLSTRICFFRAGDALYLVRNIVDGRFVPYAVIVMECVEEELFAPLNNIVWLTDASAELAGVSCLIAGNGVPASEGDTVAYSAEEKAFLVQRTLRTPDYTLRLSARSDGANLTEELSDFSGVMLLIVAFAVPMLAFVIWAFYRYVTRPLQSLMDAAGRVAAGERGYLISPLPDSREFGSLAAHFNGMSVELRDQFERSYQEQLALQDARIKALQSQINPHFLNNTLEIINWEARMADNEKICRMIEALSTMLDAATARGGKAVVTVCEELRYVDAYLYILSERYGERLHVKKEIDEALLAREVPRLILQPIVENAIEHGIDHRPSGVLILRVYAEAGNMLLEVENDGSMTDADREAIEKLLTWDGVAEPADPLRAGRIGIRNVNRRLRILYGEQSGLSIEEKDGGHILARIRLPLS